MATKQDILDKAAELGKLIRDNDSVKKYEAVLRKIQDDPDAQRLITDLNRQMTSIAEKERDGKPIEVEDKHKLSEIQQQVSQSPILGEMQMAQMDYLDLMRQVDEAIAGHSASTPPPASSPEQSGPGPIITDV